MIQKKTSDFNSNLEKNIIREKGTAIRWGYKKEGMERKRKGSRISVAFPSCLSALDCEAPPAHLATESSSREERKSNSNRVEKSNRWFRQSSNWREKRSQQNENRSPTKTFLVPRHRFHWAERESEAPPEFAANHALCFPRLKHTTIGQNTRPGTHCSAQKNAIKEGQEL